MADCGFDLMIVYLMVSNAMFLQVLVSRQQLEPGEVFRTHHIATLHIHVERAIERVNKCQITHFFSAMLCPIAEHLIIVCAFRTLFEDPQVLCPPESE